MFVSQLVCSKEACFAAWFTTWSSRYWNPNRLLLSFPSQQWVSLRTARCCWTWRTSPTRRKRGWRLQWRSMGAASACWSMNRWRRPPPNILQPCCCRFSVVRVILRPPQHSRTIQGHEEDVLLWEQFCFAVAVRKIMFLLRSFLRQWGRWTNGTDFVLRQPQTYVLGCSPTFTWMLPGQASVNLNTGEAVIDIDQRMDAVHWGKPLLQFPCFKSSKISRLIINFPFAVVLIHTPLWQ